MPYDRLNMHEVIFSDHRQNEHGVTTLDIAKRLIDYGFHPPTIYFPLIVHGALMVEPTESEGLEELDRFVEVMKKIAEEARTHAGPAEEGARHDAPQPVRRGERRAEARAALEARVARSAGAGEGGPPPPAPRAVTGRR